MIIKSHQKKKKIINVYKLYGSCKIHDLKISISVKFFQLFRGSIVSSESCSIIVLFCIILYLYIAYQVPTNNPINLALQPCFQFVCGRDFCWEVNLVKVSFNDSEKSTCVLQNSNLH